MRALASLNLQTDSRYLGELSDVTRRRQIITHSRRHPARRSDTVALAIRRVTGRKGSMTVAAAHDDNLDPQIRAFISFLREKSRQYPTPESLQLSEMRRIAEEVRQPLTLGGPAVKQIFDYEVLAHDRVIRVRTINTAPGQEKPALIYLHGGGWMLFSLDTHDRVMREIAVRADLAVLGIEYSLSPDVRFPTQLNEIRAVLDWLQAHGKEIGIDTGRMAIGGDSAGANMAVATCLRLRDEGRPRLIGAMLLCYGVYDGHFDTDSYYRYQDTRFNLGRDEMQQYWASYLGDRAEYATPLASPLRADLASLPRTFMVIAECDVLYDENVKMAQKLERSGVEVCYKVYPGTTHSFLEAVSMAEVSGRALADASDWLGRALDRLSRP